MITLELRELIFKVLNDYPKDIKLTQFKGNPIAKLLRDGFNDAINTKELLGSRFSFKGSAGQGGWAVVPWIGIFSSDSVTAQKGIYIVYLFSADHKHVYLSLNQGWTYFKEQYGRYAKSKIQNKANELRSFLTYSNVNISDNSINLDSNKNNPVGYELGNILSIKYDKDALPDNNKLMCDLSDMTQLLSYLLSIVSLNDDGYYQVDNRNPIQNNHKDTENINFKRTKVPHRSNVNRDYEKGIVSKHDYRAISKIKMDNGDYGEKLVLKIEKERLIKDGREDLADKVVHASKDIGDGLGYDIQSFDLHGNKIYIEVKATTNGKSTPFNISPNELNISAKYKDSYRLYRLYNINNSQVDYYVIKGDMYEALELTPTSYSGFPNN